MEIRQVLKSSASMYPNLFYKVGDETRRMERGGEERRGRTTARKRGVRRGGGNDPQVDVAKRGEKITEDIVKEEKDSREEERESKREEGSKSGGLGGRVQKKETPVKPLTAGAWLRSSTCASLAIS